MHQINETEILILNWIRENLSCGFLDVTMVWITRLADTGILFVALAAFCLLFKNTRKFGATFSLAMALQFFLVSGILKPLVARPRPYDYNNGIEILVKHLSSFSFPSGHTAIAFAFAFSLLVFGKKGFIPGLVFAILMGFSRMYLYVHYPTDVLFGAIIGSLFGYISYLIADKIFTNKDKNKGMEIK